ncbi:MFS transporter [Salinisphaera sp. LB1]|uniref:MFS transporter n=1 Tax=Salinisphaera sp. LB1 TaxID=2183911 RepID=UPI000D70661F|nr:MFS transporter [Salinisphaera sp. LB1]AWN16216.1 L-Proline/Glycine betaine transporter ProP [Salinisphaera sp. LB1]
MEPNYAESTASTPTGPAPVERGKSYSRPYFGHRHTPKTIIGGTIGNIMEWYDFALYGFFAPVLSGLFFPSDSHLGSLIATFGVFAVGFFMRPLGGVVFGYIGDRYGRAKVLRLSIITMGLATFLLGALPTTHQIGFWAAVLLIAVRLLQGLSVGGEFSGSVTYMVETSPLHKRGLSGSWANFGSLVGTLVGSGLAAGVSTLLPSDLLHAWGWRIPFLLGGVFGGAAYLYVRKLGGTPHMAHHEKQHADDSPLHEALTQNRRETILAIIFASGYGVAFYIPLVYLPTFASEIGSVSDGTALTINSIGIALAMPIIPLCGWLSDHVIRRRSLLILAFLAMAAAGGVLVGFAAGGWVNLIICQFLLALLIAIPLGSAPAMLVELFPVRDRLTGYSLAYNLGLGVAGGTAPMIATWLISFTGFDAAPGAYLALAALVSAGALWFMQDRSREPLR